MRLSEIGSKEIVDLSKGCSHGQLWDTEMLFERSGRYYQSGSHSQLSQQRSLQTLFRTVDSAPLEQYCENRRRHDHL